MNFQNVKDFMDKLCETYVPGNAIVIYKNNEKVFEYASGYADLETKEKMTADKMMNIYSCSKPATVVAGLQLLEKGLFLLDDPLYEYIPEFKEMYYKENGEIKKCTNPITIRNLFTMTAGFNYDINADFIKNIKKTSNGKAPTLEIIRQLSKEPLDFEPGTKWQYSLCHDVLGALIEVVSGEKFSDYAINNVFKPCGINNISYHIEGIDDKMATQYSNTIEEGKTVVEAQIDNGKTNFKTQKIEKDNCFVFGTEYDSGGAGIVTSVNEYAKFANALANNGIAKTGEKIISKGTVELLKTNQLNENLLPYYNWEHLKGYGYGLGVRTCINPSDASSIGNIGEFGWGGAAGATLLCDTKENFAFFYAMHLLSPNEGYYQPRLRNAVYSTI